MTDNGNSRTAPDIQAEKWMKEIGKIDREMVDNMDNMDSDEVKLRVLQSQSNLQMSERERQEDDRLARAKRKHDELKRPYDDAKKFQTAIIGYGVYLLDRRGVNLLEEDSSK